MKIYANERINHPQAKLIPEYLFQCEFRFELTYEHIKLMTTPLADIQVEPLDFVAYKKGVNTAWICILVSNPKASIKDLWEIAESLGCDKVDMFYIASMLGHLGIVKKIVGLHSTKQIEDMVTNCDARAFKFAAEEGHLDVLEYLMRLTDEDLIGKRINWYHYSQICANGHLNVLNYFERVVPGFACSQLEVNTGACLIRAAEKDRLNIVEFLVSFISPDDGLFRTNKIFAAEAAYTVAAINGHLSIMQHLEKEMNIDSSLAPKVLAQVMKQNPLTRRQMDVLNHLNQFKGCRVIDITDIVVIDELYDSKEVFSVHNHDEMSGRYLTM